jgi:DNA-binding MarR family transcriptional regulator
VNRREALVAAGVFATGALVGRLPESTLTVVHVRVLALCASHAPSFKQYGLTRVVDKDSPIAEIAYDLESRGLLERIKNPNLTGPEIYFTPTEAGKAELQQRGVL